MDWLDRMNRAIGYIERRLTEPIEPAKVAREAQCSELHFQRLFSFVTGVPLGEYIRRRRLTMAAFDLQDRREKVLDVALRYGYDSPEAFSRAFKKLHGASPVAVREQGVSLKAYPRITFQFVMKGDEEMNYRIEQKAAFKMCGVASEVSNQNGENFTVIPKLWDKVFADGTARRLGEAMGLSGGRYLHGAMYNFREGGMTYMIGCLCGQAAPEGYDVLEIPPLTWAVFSTPEHEADKATDEIQALWKRIFPEWFPSSGYEHAEGPELELYHCRENGKSVSEVWIPVVKRTQGRMPGAR